MIRSIKAASELGYRGHALYRFSVCSSCGRERWVRLSDLEQGKGLACRSCGYPSSSIHQRRLAELLALGAKRASELGRPVSRNRDPWYYPHKCPSCGEEVYHQRRDLRRACKKCAYLVRKTASGEGHPNWRGGRYLHEDGYILVQVQPGGPYYSMAHDRGYILEHRLVVAASIGRCLLDSEVVHHLNGNKADNRIENLELLPNDASHLPYIRLQQRVLELEREVRLLKWCIRELEHGNPVPRRGAAELLPSDVRRDYTGGTLDDS